MCGIQTIPWKSGASFTRIVCVKVARSSAQEPHVAPKLHSTDEDTGTCYVALEEEIEQFRTPGERPPPQKSLTHHLSGD